ncbi:phosphotransferase [Spirillospora sp. NBC_00431]
MTGGPASRDDERLAAALRAGIEQVDRRVALTGGRDAADRDRIRLAADLAGRLRTELGLGRFQGRLVDNPARPQLVLAFASARWGDVVLKVYGGQRPGEAAAQRLWHRHGVPAVPVLAHGDAPATWLLMRRAVGAALSAEDVAADGDLLRVTRELASVMAAAHTVGDPDLIGVRPLTEALPVHLDAAHEALTDHGYAVPRGWRATAARLHSQGPAALLHGDLGLGNVLREPGGGLLILDASAYRGHAAFEAARWSARIAGPGRSAVALEAWLEVEPDIGAERARALLGVQLLLQAGVRELVKRQRGLPGGAGDDVTHAYLAQARRYLPAG